MTSIHLVPIFVSSIKRNTTMTTQVYKVAEGLTGKALLDAQRRVKELNANTPAARKARVMANAWALYKSAGFNTRAAFANCLSAAWGLEKANKGAVCKGWSKEGQRRIYFNDMAIDANYNVNTNVLTCNVRGGGYREMAYMHKAVISDLAEACLVAFGRPVEVKVYTK